MEVRALHTGEGLTGHIGDDAQLLIKLPCQCVARCFAGYHVASG